MTKIYNNITKTIGKTPLIRLTKITSKPSAEIMAKIESFNPMSSVKDRIALGMIEEGEKKGFIKKGTVLIEATSGNTGIALAYIAAFKGYKLILTMPESMSIERRKLLKFFGAKLILTPGNQGMKGALKKAEKILKKNPKAIMLKQFENEANPKAHQKTTALEIIKATEGKIDFFIAGVGTGGTITGVGQRLKKENPNLKIIAVEPQNSAVLSGKPTGSHQLQGIGAGFIPKVLDPQVYDQIYAVKDEEAFKAIKKLAKKEGILVGPSSGAALSVALKIARKKENYNKKIVVLLPDSGERYLSTLHLEEE